MIAADGPVKENERMTIMNDRASYCLYGLGKKRGKKIFQQVKNVFRERYKEDDYG